MAICTVVCKALYNFKIKRAHEARHNQFFFQNFQNNEINEIFKMFKNTVELTFTNQKANACSPWTACSVFNWKYLFCVNLVQKLKIISLTWNFVPRTNSNMQNSLVMFTFSFFDRKYFFVQIWSKKLSVWAEISHYTNLNMQNSVQNMWCWLFLF